MYWLSLFHGVIIFWCFMKSWRYLWILISGNYITLNNFFPNPEEIINCESYFSRRDTRWFSWLRHSVTSRKVAGSIPDGFIWSWRYPSGRTMALGSAQSLTEMITRNISWSGRSVKLTTFHLHAPPIVPKSGSLNLLEQFGPVLGLYSDCLTFTSLFEEILFLWYFRYQTLLFPSSCGCLPNMWVFHIAGM
jgi:hypothetical protein